MTTGISAKKELSHAKGVVERRQAVANDIGNEDAAGYAMNNYQSMLICLFECEKHHNNAMSVLDDNNAGIVEETSALVDWSRKWVRQCEENLIMRWDVDAEDVYNKRQEFRTVWEGVQYA